MYRIKRSHHWLAVVGILALFTLLTASRIQWYRPPDFDPVMRYFILTESWENFPVNVARIELAPPAWHIVSKVVVSLTPFDVPETLRAVNYALYLSLIPVGYYIGREVHSELAGFLCAAMLPCNNFVFQMVARGDHYMSVVAATVGALAAAIAVLNKPTRRRRILYAAVVAYLGFAFYYALAFVGSLFLVGTYRTRHDLDKLRDWVLCHVPLAILYVLWLPYFFQQIQMFFGRFAGGKSFPLEVVLTPLFPQKIWPDLRVFTVVFVVAVLITLHHAVTGRVNAIPIYTAALTTLVLLVKGIVVGGFQPRHLVFLAALVPLPVAISIPAITEWLHRSSWNSIVLILVISLLVVPFGASGVALSDDQDRGDYARLSDDIESYTTDDAIILSVLHDSEGILRFYNTASDTPVYGMPVEGVTSGGRVIQPIHFNMAYDRTNYKNFDRLKSITKDHETVIVFLAHGVGYRSNGLLQDLIKLGYQRQSGEINSQDGVLVFEKPQS